MSIMKGLTMTAAQLKKRYPMVWDYVYSNVYANLRQKKYVEAVTKSEASKISRKAAISACTVLHDSWPSIAEKYPTQLYRRTKKALYDKR